LKSFRALLQKQSKCAFVIIIFLSIEMLYCPQAKAGIEMGSCKLYPSIEVKETYYDNYYLSATECKEDFVTVVTPEVYFESTGGDDEFGFRYKLPLTYYAYQLHEVIHKQEVSTFLNLKGSKHYLELEEDFKEVNYVTSYGSEHSEYNVNTFTSIFGAEFNHLGYELTWKNTDYAHGDSPNSDYTKNAWTLTGSYRILPKTKTLLEYTYERLRYDRNLTNDGDSDEFKIGIEGNLTAKLTGIIKVGRAGKDYKEKKDWEGETLYVNLTEEFSPRTSLTLAMQRSTEVSSYTTENYYETNKVSIDLIQKITGKTEADIGVTYKKDDYPEVSDDTDPREDDFWQFDIGLSWPVRNWLESDITYTFMKRNSSNATYDYESNVTSIAFKADF